MVDIVLFFVFRFFVVVVIIVDIIVFVDVIVKSSSSLLLLLFLLLLTFIVLSRSTRPWNTPAQLLQHACSLCTHERNGEVLVFGPLFLVHPLGPAPFVPTSRRVLPTCDCHNMWLVEVNAVYLRNDLLLSKGVVVVINFRWIALFGAQSSFAVFCYFPWLLTDTRS